MSARSKRKRSGTVKDFRLTPKNRSVSIRKQSLSTPRTRQETLTQMGAVQYMPPSYDDGELELLDEQAIGSKRRKTKSEVVFKPAGRGKTTTRDDDANDSMYEGFDEPVDCQPRRRSRRLMNRRDTESHTEHPVQEESMVESEAEATGSDTIKVSNVQATQPRLSEELMPPPRTPHSNRRKEVPSSQSPPDTPLSTQSRRSAREISRSPLKQRSGNVTLHLSSPSIRKAVHWPPLFEVANSIDSETGEKKILTQIRGLGTVSVPRSVPNLVSRPIFDERDNDLMSRILNNSEPRKNSGPSRRGLGSGPMKTKARSSRVGVRDFDGESEGDQLVADIDIQVPHDGIITISDSEVAWNSPVVKHEEARNTTVLTKTFASAFPKSSLEVHQDDENHTCENEKPMPTKHISQNNDSISCEAQVTSSPPQSNTATPTLRSLRHQPPTSPSEEVSLQLANDLHRIISPPHILETETQFENAWRSFTPPVPSPNDLDQFDEAEYLENPEPHDEFPDNFPHDIPDYAPDDPSDDLPPNLHLPTPSHHPVPIPPSQATTSDPTQPSSHTRFRTQSSLNQSLSSSPHPPIFSSSPTTARKGEVGRTWDENRLTDSQLLPASLMNESLYAPPMYLLEEFGEG